MIAGGTLAPGSGTPGSSLTVIGVLGFTSGSTYAININPTTSSFANVTGAATLGGATVNAIYANGSYVAKQYTILTAGSRQRHLWLAGQHQPADELYDQPELRRQGCLPEPGAEFHAHRPPAHAVSAGFGAGLNANQQNVGNTLTNFFNTTGGIPLVFGALTPAGLTQAAGETATGTQQTTFNAMTQFMGMMTDPFIGGRGNGVTPQGGAASGYASTQNTGAARDAYAMFNKAPVTTFEQRWSTWIAGFGGSQTTDGNAALGSNTTTSSIYGTAVGADYRFSPDTLAGFSLAGGGTNFSVANSGTGHSDLFQAGAFVRHTVGPAYLSAALAYGWQDVTTNRTVTIAGIDQLRARFNANAWSGRVEAGYRFVAPCDGRGSRLTPPGSSPLSICRPMRKAWSPAPHLCARLWRQERHRCPQRTRPPHRQILCDADGILTLRGRVAWAHDYDPDRCDRRDLPDAAWRHFVVNGAAQAATRRWSRPPPKSNGSTAGPPAATFEGEFSDVTRSYAGKGVVRYAW